MIAPYPAYWYLCCGRPRPMAARLALLGVTAGPALGGFGAGPALIEPGLAYFAHGNPVGGPMEAFRGVSASSFPAPAVIYGPGAPLSAESTGLAGVPISPTVGRGGAPLH